MKYRIFICLYLSFVCLFTDLSFGQDIDPNGYNVFYYPSGNKSSEGNMVNGKPDGYWKTYYTDMVLKSEGNRQNFELDGIWKFYDEAGSLTMEITYKNGKKNGKKTKYNDGILLIDEHYKNDLRDDTGRYYYEDGILEKEVVFLEGKKQGKAYEYSREGLVQVLRTYESDFIISETFINKKDKRGRKQGMWKSFHNNKRVHLEGRYLNNKREGFFREYSADSKLVNTFKYKSGELVEDVEEFRDIKIKKKYFPNAQVRSEITLVNGIANGVAREYNEDGSVKDSKIYTNGKVIGAGIVDKKGKKQGEWTEYYASKFTDDTTRLKKARGTYKNGIRDGKWKFFYENGILEQEGFYKNGKPEGEWRWYYETGNILREEIFENFLRNGVLKEYNDSGAVVIEGLYIDGQKEEVWKLNIGDYKEEGKYKEDKKDGEWNGYYDTGESAFIGAFVDGDPHGKHVYFFDTGKVREEGSYVMGLKQGVWKRYNKLGEITLATTYENGVETKINGIKISLEE